MHIPFGGFQTELSPAEKAAVVKYKKERATFAKLKSQRKKKNKK